MRSDKIIDALEMARDEYVEDAFLAKSRKRPAVRHLAAAAACLVLAVSLVALPRLIRGPGDYELTGLSENVRVYDIDRPPKTAGEAAYSLIELTEDEIFTRWNTAIFRGTVTDIQNIEVDMNGSKFYWSLVSVEVTKVFRGDIRPGDTVKIKVETPLYGNGDLWVEDQGIFMPAIYTADSTFETNGAALCLRDVAPYGFPDGVRFAFLMTGDGLIYARDFTYKSIPNAKTLDDIEAYVATMLERTNK